MTKILFLFWIAHHCAEKRKQAILALNAAEIERKVDAESEWRGLLKNMYAFLKKMRRFILRGLMTITVLSLTAFLSSVSRCTMAMSFS